MENVIARLGLHSTLALPPLGSLTYNLTSDIAALPTIFGWTVTGPLDYAPPTSNTLKIGSSDDTDRDLPRLWESPQKTQQSATSWTPTPSIR